MKGIRGINGVDGTERIVRPVLVDRIEDLVIALILLVEARVSQRECGEKD